MKNIRDITICIYGFLIGFAIQFVLLAQFHKDPFDSAILLYLPGLPALVMTLYRPQRIWKWLIASTLSLPLAMIAALSVSMSRAEFQKLILWFSLVTFLEGFIMSLGGVILGWGIRKGIQQYKLHNKSLPG